MNLHVVSDSMVTWWIRGMPCPVWHDQVAPPVNSETTFQLTDGYPDEMGMDGLAEVITFSWRTTTVQGANHFLLDGSQPNHTLSLWWGGWREVTWLSTFGMLRLHNNAGVINPCANFGSQWPEGSQRPIIVLRQLCPIQKQIKSI